MSINKNAKYFQDRDNLNKKDAYKKAKEAKKMTFGTDITKMMRGWLWMQDRNLQHYAHGQQSRASAAMKYLQAMQTYWFAKNVTRKRAICAGNQKKQNLRI